MEVNLLTELNNLTVMTVALFNGQTLNSHTNIDFSSD